VIQRPEGIGAFEFVVLARLRALQLLRGCLPRVELGHSIATTALLELANGSIVRAPAVVAVVDPVDGKPAADHQ
jgi:hypothetical protein